MTKTEKRIGGDVNVETDVWNSDKEKLWVEYEEQINLINSRKTVQ